MYKVLGKSGKVSKKSEYTYHGGILTSNVRYVTNMLVTCDIPVCY